MSECCCHSIEDKCPYGWDDMVLKKRVGPGAVDQEVKMGHVHKCKANAYFTGHCPDAGCPGRCWERAAPE